MRLYGDEDFPEPSITLLRTWGHDVVTVRDDSYTSRSDADVLSRAHSLGRCVITHNRRHFEKLHRMGVDHSGIVSATHDSDHHGLAVRIDAALSGLNNGRWCIRVNRPPTP